MAVSYNKLWKICVDKKWKKQDLQKNVGVSWGCITKLAKDEVVSMDILIKICRTLNCDIGDIMEIIPDNKIEDT